MHWATSPRHTLRVVLFINEENGNNGGKTYALRAREKGEWHVAAVESDAGGDAPRGDIPSTQQMLARRQCAHGRNGLVSIRGG